VPIFKTKNGDFFKSWSPEMAYILGFFTADGNMIRNKRGAHFIEFQITDRDLLIKIRKALGSNHKITARKRNERWKTSYRLQIGSKEIFCDLIKLGITPNKSKSIGLPQVKSRYFSHFARGYFDGDGNVWAGYRYRSNRKKPTTVLLTRFTSGSRKFIVEFRDRLTKEIGLSSNSSILFYSGGYRLSYSIKDSIKFYNFIYSGNSDLCLSRKKKIFEKFIKGR